MKEMELYYKTAANGVSALLKKFIDEEIRDYRNLIAKIDLDRRYTPEGSPGYVPSR